MKRIYITDEAYEALVEYCLKTSGSTRGMSKIASEFLLEALSQKKSEPARRGGTMNASTSKQVPQSPEKQFPRQVSTNKRSPLDNIEDLAVIRRVRSPERLAGKSREKGLLFFDLGDAGMPNTVIVMNKVFADFVASEAETDTVTPSKLEEAVSKLLREKETGYTDKEKYFIALYVLNRAGEILFNGKTWTRASPGPEPQK